MRRHKNFFTAWLKYTAELPTPELFRIWSGLGLVSAALARRVWLPGSNPALPPAVPNLYMMLVGPPGVGKDMAINCAANIMSLATEKAKPTRIGRIGGESISRKGLIDKLADERSKQTASYKTSTSQAFDFHSLTFWIGELGTAMPDYDPQLVPLLNDLFNNKPDYQDTIRGNEVSVSNPHLTLIMGNQADTLAEVFPERTFKMGLTSRILFIYSNDIIRVNIFDLDVKWDTSLQDNLIHDFIDITKLVGPYSIAVDARKAVNDFNMVRPREVPGTKFQDYNTRRPLHAQKLAICCAAATSSQKLITLEHWQMGLEFLSAAEAQMPHMFDNVVSAKGYSEVYEKIYELANQSRDILTRHAISMMLSRIYSPIEVPNIIRMLKEEGVLELVFDNGAEARPQKFNVKRIKE